jgi:pimeloyl-ACP methyl ester carboxylesterase
MKVQRRFLQVGTRRVHYFRAGEGPPAVLVHSSPANARFLMGEIERLSRDFTVFAFDTPGFGLSQALPLEEMLVADLADALAETLEAIDMPRCPVFGSHTGAAIALELGVRHPERATGLVLDGVPAFTDAECAALFGDYFRKLPVTDLGGQYASVWTRFRDQSIWFPWSERTADHLNAYDLGLPESTHLWVSMYFEAADSYVPAYRAASFYGARAIAAAGQLTLPAIYTATDTDMLRPHIDRLPPMKPGQAFQAIGRSHERKRELIAEGFMRFGAEGPAPVNQDAILSSTGINRQFVSGASGDLHLRYAGDRFALPLLLLHDAPGSSEQLEPLMAELSNRFFVMAPDLPGHGESERLPNKPGIADFLPDLVAMLDGLGLTRTGVMGIGFGSSVAVELARRYPLRVTALTLQGLALPTPGERDGLKAEFCPPIEIAADGGHWYRTWLMLRDSQVYWPWFERKQGNLRRIDADFSAEPLHRRTMDVMRARETYHHLIHAALDHDAETALAAVTGPVLVVRDRATPLSAYDDKLIALVPEATVIDAMELAKALLEASNAG